MSEQLEYLSSGYQRFRKKYFDKDDEIFKSLKSGQNPKTLIIACSDSRVDPAILMDCEPGDLFVVRNVANLVPPYEAGDEGYHGTSAALEFGVCGLNVENIVVLGHSMCGGITSLYEKEEKLANREFVNKWMDIVGDISLDKSIDQSQDKSIKANQCSKLAILKSLANLTTFPWIKEKIKNKELMLHGWYFDIKTGKIEVSDKVSQEFKEL
jgi:carbonic anhydrase